MRISPRGFWTSVSAAGVVALGALSVMAAPSRAATGDYSVELRQLSKKIDDVLASQKELMDEMQKEHADIREDLRAIKVRSYQAAH